MNWKLIRLSNISSHARRAVVISLFSEPRTVQWGESVIPQTGRIHLIEESLEQGITLQATGKMSCIEQYDLKVEGQSLLWASDHITLILHIILPQLQLLLLLHKFKKLVSLSLLLNLYVCMCCYWCPRWIPTEIHISPFFIDASKERMFVRGWFKTWAKYKAVECDFLNMHLYDLSKQDHSQEGYFFVIMPVTRQHLTGLNKSWN